ncbi:alpha/beta fold hydrolase [Butyrivibrio sp. AE2032]|uniref:alpha/beta fold hydrolase n=1 Tax=Butyrivibrio sp. AE2032 TaxID=1458463 RepID=UPI000557B264|nr:alpha/beta hydrolase [Butyrivibrio sp. AE2032]
MNYKIYNNNSKEWVLLIHGLGGSINTWKYQIEDLNEYNVLAVDLEGHGGSAFEKRRRLLTRSASEINEILESEHIEKVHVIALSLGTLVAMEFAYLYKEKVKSILLAGFVLNMGIGYKSLLAILEGIKYFVPKKVFYPVFANLMMPRKNHKKSRDIFIRESVKMKSVAFRMWLSELFRTQFKLNEYLISIEESKLPVMFISGKQDYFFVNSVKRTQKKINDASLYFIEKCGHVCSIEKHNEFNCLMIDFLHEISKREYYPSAA